MCFSAQFQPSKWKHTSFAKTGDFAQPAQVVPSLNSLGTACTGFAQPVQAVHSLYNLCPACAPR